jgi:hypothetical protein
MLALVAGIVDIVVEDFVVVVTQRGHLNKHH